MTSKQATRAAEILRDLSTSLPCGPGSHSRLKFECRILARALEGFVLEKHTEEITDKELFDERRADYNARIAG